jgi:hypothetical protein
VAFKGLEGGWSLGRAVWEARAWLREAFPSHADWLAYAHFGHPDCMTYRAEPGRGFALFEALGRPEGEPFVAGRAYPFRATYRPAAPAWYQGRMWAPAPVSVEGVRVTVVPLVRRAAPQTCPLEPVPGGRACQGLLTLAVPRGIDSLPLLVRFEQAGEELRTLELELEVVQP